MTAMEITLLVLGVIIFAVSFFIKDKNGAKSNEFLEDQEEQIRRMVDNEFDSIKLRVNEATDETVEYAMDKAERSLEKLSNEKIMAVSDYSNMVMEEIDKNHKEVMFLYDMLSDKQVDVKNSVRKVEATVKEVKSVSEKAQSNSEEIKKDLKDFSDKKIEEVKAVADSFTLNKNELPDQYTYEEKKPLTGIDIIKAKKAENKIQPVFNALDTGIFETVSQIEAEDMEKPFIGDDSEGKRDGQDSLKEGYGMEGDTGSQISGSFPGIGGNNNQKIIELYEEGMDTVDIAKMLNLGVGEVRLVIDLFKR